MTTYDPSFYTAICDWSRSSASRIVPFVLGLLHPKSVVDVGCGTGEWLAAFTRNGVFDVLGLDGAYVKREQLVIPLDRFVICDLPSIPTLGRRFDLVISLEVGEHLPRGDAEKYVDSLTSLGDTILFSAAIPAQGGRSHVNEQWPDYWANLFESRQYVTCDAIRNAFWNDRDVSWFYAQNTLLFVRKDQIEHYAALAGHVVKAEELRRLVHPALHELRAGFVKPTLGSLARALPSAVFRSIRTRLNVRA